MAKSKLKDRIVVSFYEEVQMDNILVEALNRIAPPRMRGIKLKEWALEYLKTNNIDLFNEIQNNINNINNQSDKNNNIILENNEKNQQKRKNIANKLNIITK
jgi:hypothetical protein